MAGYLQELMGMKPSQGIGTQFPAPATDPASLYETLFKKQGNVRDLQNAMTDEWETGQLLPIKRNRLTGDRDWAVPGFLEEFLGAAHAPGKALQGGYGLTVDGSGRVGYDGMIEDAANLAGGITLGAGAIPGPAGALRMGASFKKLSDIEDLAARKGVKLHVSDTNDVVTLSAIVVPKEQRGQGVGSEIMQALASYADANGKTIAATPSLDFGGSSKAALERFYKRHGFSANSGSKRDFRFRDTMRRDPAK